MTSIPSQSAIRYSQKTFDRAERAVRCAPFRLKLYATMLTKSVSLLAVAGIMGIRHQYSKRAVTEIIAEGELLWLIEVGLLRREVDGQGLTDSFRLTPLGHQLVARWHNSGRVDLQPTWGDRFCNALSRWFRLPF